MKFKITKLGNLEIWRKSKYQLQLCPFTRAFNCSDSCPLFNEPMEHNGTQIVITLCRKHLVCSINDFIDERK